MKRTYLIPVAFFPFVLITVGASCAQSQTNTVSNNRRGGSSTRSLLSKALQ